MEMCSFCGRLRTEGQLVLGPCVSICDSCIDLAKDIIEHERNQKDKTPVDDGSL